MFNVRCWMFDVQVFASPLPTTPCQIPATSPDALSTQHLALSTVVFYRLPCAFYRSSTALLFLRSKRGSLLCASIISLKIRFLAIRDPPQTVPKQKNKNSSKPSNPAPAILYHPFPQKNTTQKFDFFKFCGIFKCRGAMSG